MKLILYNHFHNGDHYFSQPLVKAIRKYNPEIEIDLCISCYDYLYSDIENITVIHDSPLEKGVERCKLPYYNVDENTDAISLWVGCSDDFFFKEACSVRIYNSFKNRYVEKFNINLPDILDIELLPRTPITDIYNFLNWKDTHNSSIIFYNDLFPRSGQKTSSTDHSIIIDRLCTLFPTIYFITSDKLSDKNNNISTVCDFNYIQTYTGEHLCKNTKMYPYCDLIISFDVGSCFNYIEEDVLKSKAKILHIACTPHYFNKLSYNVENTDLYNLFLDKCVYCEASDTSQTIEVIVNNIMKHIKLNNI